MLEKPASSVEGGFMKVGISRFVIVAAIAALMLTTAAIPILAQSPNFSDFTSNANLSLNGNAAAPVNNGTTNVLRLTPALVGQRGSAWFNIQQPVAGGFTTTFQFQLTQGSVPPADGIAFVIQNSSLSALGQGGGSIGYADGGSACGDISPPCGGIPNSLAVEFDTFNNAGVTDDPNANHIAVQSCGVSAGVPQPNSPAHGTNDLGFPVCLIGSVANPIPIMSNGDVHTVIIDYTPSCGSECPGTLTVNLDTINVLTASVTIENELNLNPGGNAWVGFTGATGAAFENHDILSWTFTPHSSTSVNNISVPPGGTGVASFGSFNYKVHNTTNGTMNFSVTAIPVPPTTNLNFSGAQCIVYDGTGGNCWEFQATCNSGTCAGNNFELATSYDATGPFPGPGFLKGPAPCNGTTFASNQITEFLVQRNDPTTRGGSGGGLSCWVATKTTPTPYTAFVQQPINADGSSVFTAKRGVVPVKFTLPNNGSATCSLPPATIAVTRTAGGTLGSVDESIYTLSADSGSNFRVSGCQYVYNLATSALGVGTYRVDISIAGSVVGSATFALK
jgi:Bacterial lectin